MSQKYQIATHQMRSSSKLGMCQKVQNSFAVGAPLRTLAYDIPPRPSSRPGEGYPSPFISPWRPWQYGNATSFWTN